MTQQDWIIVISLVVVAVAIAYAMGARQRKEAPERPRSRSTAPARTASLPENATKAAAPKAKAAAAKKSEEVPVPLAKLDYEEDSDIDPTKVGRSPAPKPPIYQPPVTRIVHDENAATDEPTQIEPLFLVSATAQTDTGLRRKRNEDSLLVLDSSSLFVVADGMGGYEGGQLASQLAVQTISNAYRSSSFDGPAHENVAVHASELARAIQMANAAVLETAKAQPKLAGMGTTLCAARFSGNKRRLYIGHVGDSRCYRLRGGTFVQMTADHTMADLGVVGPGSAHLSRAVGIWPAVPIDIVMAVPLPNDLYLLCSDGLTKMLSDDAIADVLRGKDDLKGAVEELIAAANAGGGKDNVTVILIRVAEPRSADVSSPSTM